MPPKRTAQDAKALHRLGKNLRHLRVEHDLAQDVLAREAGVANSHYASMERGEVNPSLLVLLRLTRATNTTIEELLTGVR